MLIRSPIRAKNDQGMSAFCNRDAKIVDTVAKNAVCNQSGCSNGLSTLGNSNKNTSRSDRNTRGLKKQIMNGSEPPKVERESEENWWDYCPVCSSKLVNQKCRYICSHQNCQS